MSTINTTIIDALKFRYACKKFDPAKKISDKDFHTIMETGRLSPSSFGFEPWKFLDVQSAEMKKKLFPIAWGAQNSLNGASHFVIILARKKIDMVYDSEFITHIMTDIQKLPADVVKGKREAYKAFQKNDFDLLESDRAMFDWSCKQTYIALGNMLTAAALSGIDACPIEGFNRKAVEELLTKEGVLDAEHFGVSVMAGFGYRDETPYPKTRQELKDIFQKI